MDPLDLPLPFTLVLAAAAALAGLWLGRRRWGPHPLYLFILAATGLAAAWAMDDGTYLAVFWLGILTAFAEIIGKFPDEPLKALGTPHALGYLLLNGVIAVAALYLLEATLAPETRDAPGERIATVLGAGFGAMMVMRSKVFNLKVGGEEVALGPEQVILVYFRFMEAAIDRARARSRIEFVQGVMRDIDFHRVRHYSVAMLDAAQLLEEDDRRRCEEAILKLEGEPHDDRVKAYRLGFLLLNLMGEDFVRQLFLNPPPEWLVRAPRKERPEGLLRRFTAIRQDVPYMAFATSMNGADFRRRLGWTDMEETKFREQVQPRRCTLRGWRLAFDKPGDDPASPFGEANLEPDPAGVVEGVLYRLPRESIEFLDRTERGYVRQEVTVTTADGKETRAHVYRAETTRDGLLPDPAYLRRVLDGAREHALPAEYVAGLERMLAGAEAEAEAGALIG